MSMYLVFTTTCGMGKECLMYHSHRAVCQNSLLDQTQNQNPMHTLKI